MKHLLFIAAFLGYALFSAAQFPNSHSASSPGTLEHDLGGRTANGGFVNTRFADTLTANRNYIAGVPGGQIIVGNIVYIRNTTATAWIAIGSGSSGADTSRHDSLFAERPLSFDSISHPGSTIIKFLHPNGLVDGGVVTKAGCLSLDVTAAMISLNFKTYISSAVTLAVPPADGTLPRRDLVVMDTLGNVYIVPGTPSITPIAAPTNPSSQVVLSAYTIAGGASCLDINSEIIYDENTEWTPTTAGTISVDFDNTDNHYNGLKDAFISSYASGGSVIFTRSSPVSAQASEILKLFVYSNGVFNNQFQITFYNGSTQVGNTVTFNSGYGFNPLNANVYQDVAIAFSAFNITNQQIDKMVITFGGDDLSGAKGLYLDFIQLQTGNNNTANGHGVFNFAYNDTHDSIVITRDDGVRFPVAISGGGGGGGTLQQAFDAAPTASPQINAHGNSFGMDSLGGFTITSYDDLGGYELLHLSTEGNTFLTHRDSLTADFSPSVNNGGDDGSRFSSAVVQATNDNGVTYHQQSLQVSEKFSLFTGILDNGNAKAKVAFDHIDTLLSPPTYIAAFDGDTLKKALNPVNYTVLSGFLTTTADSTSDPSFVESQNTTGHSYSVIRTGVGKYKVTFDAAILHYSTVPNFFQPLAFKSPAVLSSDTSIIGGSTQLNFILGICTRPSDGSPADTFEITTGNPTDGLQDGLMPSGEFIEIRIYPLPA